VKSINGISVTDWVKAVSTIRASANKPLTVIVNRAGTNLTVTVTPAPHQVNGKTQGMIGVINKVGLKRQSFINSIKGSGTLTKQLFTSSVSSLVSLPTKIVPLFKQTFLHQKRDPQGLVGVVGVARVSAQTASAKNVGAGEKVGNFLLIIASLNIFVGIFNLLPLLPLDGGHMAIAIIDGIRRTWARQRKKPLPAPFDVERLTPITIAVFIFLASLSLLLLAADIFNPVQLNM
jgi:membrane-associated protease RseP (regulator of RpoE activity)